MFTVRKSTRGAATKEVDFVRTSTPSGSLFAAKGIWLISTDIAGKHDVAAATKLAAALCPHV